MKVIKAGKWQNPWSGKVVCEVKACEAELELNESDVKVRGYRDECSFYVICGICGHDIPVKKEDLPQRILEGLNMTLKFRSYYD